MIFVVAVSISIYHLRTPISLARTFISLEIQIDFTFETKRAKRVLFEQTLTNSQVN
jgi:hypothetical protein